jgi:hypothetical protein
MDLLIRWPGLALLPALAFGFVWTRRRRRVVAVAAGAWLVYTLYELGISAGVLCDAECNIRVDLLLLYPLLAGLSLWAAIVALRTRPATG